MNGNEHARPRGVERVLSYEHYAPPLTIDKIKADLDDAFVDNKPEVDVIVMWEHQLDWLLKVLDSSVEYGASPSLRSGASIWGIPLEMLK